MIRSRLRSLMSLSLAAALVAGAALSAVPYARAQTPSNPAPYNIDLGALITNTLRTAGTVTTDRQANTNWRGVVCKFVETASSGSPSTTFSIQGYDAATASYSTLGTSGAATGGAANVTGQTVIIYPNATLTTVPTGWVLNAVALPRSWRVSQTIAGTGGPASTSKIGCNYLL